MFTVPILVFVKCEKYQSKMFALCTQKKTYYETKQIRQE